MQRCFVLLALALLVGGCSSIVPNKKVIRFSNWGGASDGGEYAETFRGVIAEFERQNPGVEVQMEGIPGSQDYVRKTLLSYSAGAEPDVLTLDASSAAVFINNGVLQDLTPQFSQDSEFKIDDFYPNVVDIARREDKLYAIPLDFNPMVMMCNRKLFRDAGVEMPPDNWTTAQFLETAKKLTKGNVYGFKFTNWMPGWIMWMWNRGGDVLNPEGTQAKGTLDSPQNEATIQFLADLTQKHKVAPSLSEAAAAGVDSFLNGTAAMEVIGHWGIVGYKAAKEIKMEDIWVMPLPSDTGQSQTVVYEAGLGIGKHCKQPELAWKFIKYMTSYDVQVKLTKTGNAICARRDVSADKANDELEKRFLKIIPTGRVPWGAKVEGYDYVENEGQKMLDNILKAGQTPKEALRQMAENVDRHFAEMKE